MIPFHLPNITGNEINYIQEVISSGKLSGNGIFTKKCHHFFESTFQFPKVLLTNSCTDALEMCALLLDLKPGDEVILPSYTFVSTANAFYNFGVKPVFIDSGEHNPNLNADSIAAKITPKTKAIVVMHYAGIGCDMENIMKTAKAFGLPVIEDAALGLGSRYKDKWLGGIGDLATFSFHQTKNITCGEGGLLVINNRDWAARAEIIWEKGTNRAAFLRGESEKYEWVSKGSSFLTSELHAAFLLAQIEKFEEIQSNLLKKWNYYFQQLSSISDILLPEKRTEAQPNGSLFYFIFKNEGLVDKYIRFMNENGILVTTHYRCLHKSNLYKNEFGTVNLINCQKIAENLVRLPLYTRLSEEDQEKIISTTKEFFNSGK